MSQSSLPPRPANMVQSDMFQVPAVHEPGQSLAPSPQGPTKAVTGPCWVWTTLDRDGYGIVEIDGKSRRMHRVSYEHHHGPVPSGLQLDHLCRNRACFNPRHLEPVTARVNTMRGNGPAALNARATHCKKGHELSGTNLIVYKRGNRNCRECAQAWKRKRRTENLSKGLYSDGRVRASGPPLDDVSGRDRPR